MKALHLNTMPSSTTILKSDPESTFRTATIQFNTLMKTTSILGLLKHNGVTSQHWVIIAFQFLQRALRKKEGLEITLCLWGLHISWVLSIDNVVIMLRIHTVLDLITGFCIHTIKVNPTVRMKFILTNMK